METHRVRFMTVWATILLCAELVAAVAGGIWMSVDDETDLAGALRTFGFIGVVVWGTWVGFLRPRVVVTPETIRVVNMLGGLEFGRGRLSRAGFTAEEGLVFRLDDRSEHKSVAFSGGKSASLSRPGAEKLLADLEALRPMTSDHGAPSRHRSWAAIGSGLLVFGVLVSSFVV